MHKTNKKRFYFSLVLSTFIFAFLLFGCSPKTTVEETIRIPEQEETQEEEKQEAAQAKEEICGDGFCDNQLRKKPVRTAGTSIAMAVKKIVCSSRDKIGSNHSVNEESCGDSHPMAVKPNEYPIMLRKIQSLLFLTIFLRISHCADPMINPIKDPAMAAAFSSLSRGCRPPPIFAINR